MCDDPPPNPIGYPEMRKTPSPLMGFLRWAGPAPNQKGGRELLIGASGYIYIALSANIPEPDKIKPGTPSIQVVTSLVS